MMKSISPGLIKPSSRRACSSMALGSSRRRRAMSRSSAFSVRARSSDRSSAEYSRRACSRASRPFSPAMASTTMTRVMKTSAWRSSRRPRLARVALGGAGGGGSRAAAWLSSCSVMGSANCPRGPFRFAVAQVILERANQHRSKIGPFIHGPNLRGPPELPRELDGRFHRVAVSPLCRHYGSSVSTQTARRQDSKTVDRVHTFTPTRLHMQAVKTVLRFYGSTRSPARFTGLGLGA